MSKGTVNDGPYSEQFALFSLHSAWTCWWNLRRNWTQTCVGITLGWIQSPSFVRVAQPCLPQLRVLLFVSRCLTGKGDSSMGWTQGIGELRAPVRSPPPTGDSRWAQPGTSAGEGSRVTLWAQPGTQLQGRMGKYHLEITGHMYKHGQTTADSSIFPVTVRGPFSPARP